MNKSLLEKIEDLHSKVFRIFAKSNTKNKIQTQSFKKTQEKISKKIMRKKMVTENFDEKVMLLRNL